ncbi:conjugal transfer protein [Pseudomonas fulva]|uniref:conjugal transfer protein n=1 Tax=Pseudomonas fulva TaxID=47880 RepID=UPI002DB9A32F|nr:conjugal transfer protein [Pseudomonas fulva]MEB8059276.1 conjugal transfer protein [Pseudomonas fulva]
MIKASMCAALLMALCCLPVASNATVCRAGQAAQTGSEAGYEQAKKAAEVWAEREKTVSDQLQDCLSRIRQTSINLPTFPSLSGVLSKVAEQICRSAVDKINSHIPSTIDPWSSVNISGGS